MVGLTALGLWIAKNTRNDTEETEVAQLLVDLPTKTMRMETSFASNGPLRRPFRLWTDMPIEETVHVQGIPGGDTSLFGGLSSIFTPQLWKCTGYVPKKFNFQHREFPGWDMKNGNSRMEQENESLVDKGAGVLFSLSKVGVLATPVGTLAGMRDEENGFYRKASLKVMKKWRGDNKEDYRTSRDRSGKMSTRSSDKEADAKRSSNSSKTVAFTPATYTKQLEFHEDRGPKVFKANTVENNVEEPNINIPPSADGSSEALCPDVSRQEHNDDGNASVKEEGEGQAVDIANDSIAVRSAVHPSSKDTIVRELKDNQVQEFDSDMSPSCVQPNYKAQEIGRLPETVSDCTDKADELSCQMKPELEGSECSLVEQNCFSEIKDCLGSAEEQSNSGGTISISQGLVCQHKLLSAGGKLFRSSSTMVSKLTSNEFKLEDTENVNSIQIVAGCNGHIKKVGCLTDVVRDEEMHEVPRKTVKERPKSSATSSFKALHSSRSLQDPVSKQINSDSKDLVVYSSAKASLAQNAALNSAPATGLLHHPKALQAQSKSSASRLPQRVERPNQTNINPSTRLYQNNALSVYPSSISNSATLSDEELALLLHQELNSSPRVPRVPRARYAGTLPQWASSSSTSMLIKRTSGSGGKDHSLVSRRKYRDTSRDGFCSSHELEDDSKNMERVSSFPDQRKQDTIYTEDASIMIKGRRMTYEKLCHTVLPHWHNLRKHNEERYAYSSPSQAVLDGLRNHQEWAWLVDRGTKTNSNRKRRKVDAEESDDNENGKDRTVKAVEGKSLELHKEEFPKGKRKARKRRQLALQGRAVKDVRKRQRADMLTDGDSGPFSNSSEESFV
ncbi:PHD finger protein [Quillaja saponaria]|uniref:PHD finger protein n=1 Tax=Quillaja saponaria TaxID=32244 RepID=A0AAD7P7G4_QUISA|nr:PHD finger protein [Quillaja saponaria]